MSRLEAVAGVDVGTTTAKVMIQDLNGVSLALVDASTPWTTTSTGGTEVSAESVIQVVADLLNSAFRVAEARSTGLRILGVGVTGLAESGVLLDGSGRPCTPVIAWFDRRGAQQIARRNLLDGDFGRRFVRRTGLPWDSQASVAKLLWFAEHGVAMTPGHRWLSIPEYVVHRLGGEMVSEPSLASRTGLVDQATGRQWVDGTDSLGLPKSLLPGTRAAGESAGSLHLGNLPAGMQGAALTVAGHDHSVAAIGVGATGPDELFNSAGTADVIARSLPGPLTDADRERLVGQGVSVGSHALRDTTLLLGGARGGLLLRRVLGLLGAGSGSERDRLDSAAQDVDALPPGLEISGAGPTGNDVLLRVGDDVDPAVVWAAATRYTAAETRRLLDSIHEVVRPHRRAVASGGWTRMASVRRAKSAVIDRLEFSHVSEPGAVGAAALARQAAALPTVLALPKPLVSSV